MTPTDAQVTALLEQSLALIRAGRGIEAVPLLRRAQSLIAVRIR